MASSSDTLKHIRIAKLQFCHHDFCPFSQNLHLQVDYDHVELSSTGALAISYTWGEFDRERVKIGHDSRGEVVEMELGKEWDLQEMVVRLAMLCIENGEENGSEHAGVWIDQLCIRQTDDAEVRATLASIPIIYRTLEVVILMPGGLCACLREAHKKVLASPEARQAFRPLDGSTQVLSMVENTREDESLLGTVLSRELLDCANTFGVCSYFERVWTRQELLYSRSVRVVRTRDEEMPCAKSPDDAGHLSSFAGKLYHRLLKVHPPQIAFLETQKANMKFWSQARSENFNFGSSRTKLELGLVDHSLLTLLDFLLGQKLEKLIPRDIDIPVWYRLQDFLLQVLILSRSPRKATRARDYVTSVWVDCPGYVLPANYKNMCLPSLLDDGIHQLESKHGISIRVSCLAGLFGLNSVGSALWRPRTYLGRRKIDSVSDVYGPVLSCRPLPITPFGEIPLRFTPLPTTTFSEFATEYSQLFSNAPMTDVVEELGSIIRKWSTQPASAIFNLTEEYMTISPTAEVNDDPRIRFMGKLISKRLGDIFRTTVNQARLSKMEAAIWRGSEEFDHYQVVYDLVARALGLKVRDCQNYGLKLMVVPGQCIGFAAPVLMRERGCEKVITVSSMDFNDSDSQYLTEGQQRDRAILEAAKEYGSGGVESVKEHGWATLEVIKITDYPVPKYRVAGIWVPHNIGSLKVRAYVNQDDYDALLE